MTHFSTRVFTLVLMSWANIYCCCTSAARASEPAPPAAHQIATHQTGKHCCAAKRAAEQPAQKSEQRQPMRHDCDECKFFAIRQNTLIEPAHRDVPALSLCLISDALVLSPIAVTHAESRPVWSDAIRIPTALLDLNTCLLR